MFNKKTVMVVGAGASHEAGLPVGRQLKAQIAKLLDIRFDENERGVISGDPIMLRTFRASASTADGRPGNIDPYLSAGWAIRDAMPLAISIDNFLDTHNTNKTIELCGKLAIVRAILQAEMESLMYVIPGRFEEHPDYNRLSDTWFTSFVQLLSQSGGIEDIGERLSSVGFVVFNYDRCIEHFLFHSFQTYYGIGQNKAAELVNSIQIYHPYGTVGYLPWQQGDDVIDFGAKPHPNQLLSLATQIKTFTEGTDENSSAISKIRNLVSDADIIVFLGFAFHPLNLRLLTPVGERLSVECDYYATALGISNSNCEGIEDELIAVKKPRHQTGWLRNDLSCRQLLEEYWRSLS